jgi:hypothetical protein
MEQQQVAPLPPPPLQQLQQHVGSSILATVLSNNIRCSKLVPSLAGLLNFLNQQRSMRAVKVFLDASITESTPDKVCAAGELQACCRRAAGVLQGYGLLSPAALNVEQHVLCLFCSAAAAAAAGADVIML